MSKRAAIYARVSYDDRDNDGRNLAGQLELGREYCAKHGYQIVEELAEDDRGVSGAEIDLTRLNQARDMARRRMYDVLVVRELDRLSRNLGKQLVVEEELKRNGVSVEFVLYDYPDNPEGRLMKNIRGSFAEFEREKIRERMMRGKRYKVNAGSVLVSTGAPFGYRLKQHDRNFSLVVHPTEAAVVQQIFLWFAQDAIPIREIVRKLDQLGAPIPESGGRKRKGGWPRSTIFRILRNRTYIGEWDYTYDGTEHLTVRVPLLVERGLWSAAQEIMDKNKERMARATKYEYLFGRRLTCGICGRYMACEPQHRGEKLYLYYVCGGKDHNRVRGCKGTRVRVDLIDAVAWDWLTEILEDPDRLQRELDVYQDHASRQNAPTLDQLRITNDLLEDNQTKLNRLADLYISGAFSMEDLQERKMHLEQVIFSLQNQRTKLTASLEGQVLTQQQIVDIKSFAVELRKKLNNATYENKMQLFQLLKVSSTLNIQDGKRIFQVSCVFRPNPDGFMIDDIATRLNGPGIAMWLRCHGWCKGMWTKGVIV